MNIYDSYDINEAPNNLSVLVVFNTSVSIMSWYVPNHQPVNVGPPVFDGVLFVIIRNHWSFLA